jgi:hypothetical protein
MIKRRFISLLFNFFFGKVCGLFKGSGYDRLLKITVQYYHPWQHVYACLYVNNQFLYANNEILITFNDAEPTIPPELSFTYKFRSLAYKDIKALYVSP